MRNEERNKAATYIQAKYKGNKARKDVEEKKDVENIISKDPEIRKKQEKVTIKIQSNFKAMLKRRHT